MTLVPVTLRVNGRDHDVEVAPTATLLEVLRRELKLFGAREACGVGMCGACTVLVDGQPVSGCLMLAVTAAGRELVTVEGLESPDGEVDAVQQAYIDHTAFQCSYCTPGFVLMTRALLDENPDASEDEVREYLGGNLCRCGSYVKIMDAALAARDRLRASPPSPPSP